MKRNWMKKALALGLSAVMAAGSLAGCAEKGDVREEGDELPETAQVRIYNPINTKTINSSGFYELVEYLYEKEYPEVEMDYRTSEMAPEALVYGSGVTPEMGTQLQQYYDSVPGSITSGSGEDVIFADCCCQWFDNVTPPDYNRMIAQGAFVDLKPLLSTISPELDLSLYDSLLVDDKLYAVPVSRQPYYLFSAENMLQKWGFDFNAQDDALTFLRKCAAWQKLYEGDEDVPVVFTKQAWEYVYRNIFNIMGVSGVNYQTGDVSFDSAEVREALELLKALKSDYEEPLMDDLPRDREGEIYEQALFGSNLGGYSSYIIAAYGYNYLEDPVVLVPLLQLDGKTATTADTFLMIPENAENKLNAARYIALVLESVVSYQKREGKISRSAGYSNTLFSWDAGFEAFNNWLLGDRQLLFMAADAQGTVKSMYQNQGRVCTPCYWFYNLKDMFDSYMAGDSSLDTLMSDVQSRLKSYVNE